MRNITIWIFLSTFSLLACNDNINTSDKDLSKTESAEERFYRHEREGFYALLKKINLPDISGRGKNFEFRCFAGTQDRRFTFVNIRNLDKKWQYTQSYIYMSSEDVPYTRGDTSNHYLQGEVDSLFTKKILLIGNETEFIDSLKLLLVNFPREHDLDNTLLAASGGDGFIFEVANTNDYFYLPYVCYSEIVGKPQTHAQVRLLLNYLNQHLNLDFVECSSGIYYNNYEIK